MFYHSKYIHDSEIFIHLEEWTKCIYGKKPNRLKSLHVITHYVHPFHTTQYPQPCSHHSCYQTVFIVFFDSLMAPLTVTFTLLSYCRVALLTVLCVCVRGRVDFISTFYFLNLNTNFLNTPSLL